MNFYYGEKVISNIEKAIPMYAKKEFKSPYRSTVPLLSYLKHEITILDLLLRELEMPEVCDLHLEYKVKPPKGRGNASHTDLMVISAEASLAVEAKWTESRYETVGKWLEKGSDQLNRHGVLIGWLGLLQKHAQHTLHLADFSGAVYQMVHRAASACSAGGHPRMAYIVFEPSPDPKTAGMPTIRDDLTHLWSLLGKPKGFPFYLVEVQLSPTAEFDAIAPLLKGNNATAQQVSAALLRSARLFDFEKYLVKRVGGKS